MTYKTVQEVVNTLAKLDSQLPKNEIAFNHAYWVISRNIKNQTFEDPQIMEKLDIDFAEYYFQALQNFQAGKNLDAPWNRYFRVCNLPISNRLICLALGGYTHIKIDLPLSLAKFPPSKNDFEKVQIIINQSLPEILEYLGYRHFQGVYIFIMKTYLFKWRNYAWKSGTIR